jgi:opacity protein-like surface antigen
MIMRLALLLAVPVLAVAPLAAQDYYPHHNFTFGVGGAVPQADLSQAMQTAPGISIGYGYRFHRYFQADAALDMMFGAAGGREFEVTQIGNFRISDREYFVPLGGRVIAPLFSGKVLLYGGGGGAFMKYSTRLSQPSNYYKVGCITCTTRSGWGYYAQAGVDYFLWTNIRVGVAVRSYRGNTDGEPVGGIPGIQTKDQWLSTLAQIGFSF